MRRNNLHRHNNLHQHQLQTLRDNWAAAEKRALELERSTRRAEGEATASKKIELEMREKLRDASRQRDDCRKRMLRLVAISQRQAHAIVARRDTQPLAHDTPRLFGLKEELQASVESLKVQQAFFRSDLVFNLTQRQSRARAPTSAQPQSASLSTVPSGNGERCMSYACIMSRTAERMNSTYPGKISADSFKLTLFCSCSRSPSTCQTNKKLGTSFFAYLESCSECVQHGCAKGR